jgi:hypothetical protein
MLQVHLVADAGARRHHLEIVERLAAPLQELVALAVPLILELDVILERLRRAELVDHHRVIDDEVDGNLRVDLLRIAAEAVHRIAHRREIDHAGHAGEILHQHARRAVLDLAVGRDRVLLPGDHRLDVVRGDGDAVLETQQVLQQHLHREGQARDIAQLRRRLGERIIAIGLAADVQRLASAQRVLSDSGHA